MNWANSCRSSMIMMSTDGMETPHEFGEVLTRGLFTQLRHPIWRHFQHSRRYFPTCPRPQTPYCMRNPHPCYLQSFSSKLQGQHVQASPNAQCPSPDAYNEGALGVQSPATPDLEPGPQFFTEASHCYGLPSGKISRPSDTCKQVIDGAQPAQLHHVDYL